MYFHFRLTPYSVQLSSSNSNTSLQISIKLSYKYQSNYPTNINQTILQISIKLSLFSLIIKNANPRQQSLKQKDPQRQSQQQNLHQRYLFPNSGKLLGTGGFAKAYEAIDQ
jgi:hypothetical protein